MIFVLNNETENYLFEEIKTYREKYGITELSK